MEYPAGSGSVDIYAPRHRLIIEAKRPHTHSLPDHKTQLDGYVKTLAQDEAQMLRFDDSDTCDFIGILTDGRAWNVWRYHAMTGAPIEAIKENFIPSDGNDLLRTLIKLYSHAPIGKPIIPANPLHLFRGWLEKLNKIYQGLRDENKAHTNTKMSLWLDMLRTSRMVPEETVKQHHLFVSHTFLVSLSRGVIHAVGNPHDNPDPNRLLGDGFVAWVMDTFDGKRWAKEFLAEVNKYDWTRNKTDVLRPLYEEIVDEKDRQAFGEFYTPNWLAEFIVGEVLDDDWCEQSINASLLSDSNPERLNGVGVLDPSCGSGTFLYYAARRLLNSDAMNQKGLAPKKKAEVVSHLVNGIDVHPVAAEMSRATLTRALGWEMEDVQGGIRIYEGDSLQIQMHKDSLFQPEEDEVQFVSPMGTRVNIPLSFLQRTDFASSIRRLVETAVGGHECPQDIIETTPPNDRPSILQVHENLVEIIKAEGNSVWAWYIVNMAGPYQIAKRKINRIVANPPWVTMSNIQDKERKQALKEFAQNKVGIWPLDTKNAPHLDIASLFVVRCRELYMDISGHDPAAWIVKMSALSGGGWSGFREKHDRILAQSLNLVDVKPFGQGDARRSCVLFDNRKASALYSVDQTKHVVARWNNEKKTPDPRKGWGVVSESLEYAPSPRPYPSSESEYEPDIFRQGATITPMVLTHVDNTYDLHMGGGGLLRSDQANHGGVMSHLKRGSFHLSGYEIHLNLNSYSPSWLIPT